MSNHGKSVQFGDLILTFTSAFTLRWNDKGSGGDHDGAFWQPKPPSGFYALGSLGVKGYDDQNGKNWALCVAEAKPGSGALAAPKDFQLIWTDKGSGADRDGSCWRPIPPDGYVALGDVFMAGHGTKPSADDVRCVRKDLTTFGVIGDLIWNDSGTGSDKDFSAWSMAVPGIFIDEEKAAISPHTFYGIASHSKPQAVISVLAVTLPVQQGAEPPLPTLDSRSRPADRTTPVVDRVVTVPFTAIVDPDVTLQWQLDNSPFYDIERSVYYRLALYDDNYTSEPQTKEQDVEVGVTKDQSSTWEAKTGISVAYESGVSLGVSAKVTATISIELGFSHTTSVSNFRSTTLKATLTTPANHAAALWDIGYIFTLRRDDGVAVSQNLDFSNNGNFLERQYPAAEAQAAVTMRYFPALAA